MRQDRWTPIFFVSPMISDFAILQRDQVIVVRGGGSVGTEFCAEFQKADENTGRTVCVEKRGGIVSADGIWKLKFKQRSAGGPYTFLFTVGGQKLSFSHIYIGDVWLLSGQSNMQLSMERVKYRFPIEYEEGISPLIRQFQVPIGWDFVSETRELDHGSWVLAEPGTVSQFSAAGFFFARKLFERYHVPIGLILSAVGGTPVEAWMSRDALKDFPEVSEQISACRDSHYVSRQQKYDCDRITAWWKNLDDLDQGIKERWFEETSDECWGKLSLDQPWEEIPDLMGTGSFWLRTRIEIPPDRAGVPVRISLGTIADADFIYVNGRLAGSTGYQYPPREYELSDIQAGELLIVLRVVAVHGQGGFTKDKEHLLIWGDGVKNDITKHWEYHLGATVNALAEQTFFERKPLGMYQKMIAPLHDFSIKGICWYQGEMNVEDETRYPVYFERMIMDWRKKWSNPQLPVLFVQLPNYMGKGSSNWIAFRNMQRSLTKIPHTGMVVTVDCGEINDLHPTDKKTVGERLAMGAVQIAYGEFGSWLSPLFAFGEWRGNELILHFDHAEDGLDTKDKKDVHGFCAESISGIISIQPKIKENTVMFSFLRDEKETLTAIRYAWSNDPQEANVCNRKGLPASPFLYLV